MSHCGYWSGGLEHSRSGQYVALFSFLEHLFYYLSCRTSDVIFALFSSSVLCERCSKSHTTQKIVYFVFIAYIGTHTLPYLLLFFRRNLYIMIKLYTPFKLVSFSTCYNLLYYVGYIHHASTIGCLSCNIYSNVA